VKASVSSTAHFEASHTSGAKNCEHSSTTEKKTLTFPDVTLPKFTSETYSFTQFEGKVNNLKFTAIVDQTFSDGTTQSFPISGTYSGVSYSQIYQSFDDWTENVHHCGSAAILAAGVNANFTILSSRGPSDELTENVAPVQLLGTLAMVVMLAFTSIMALIAFNKTRSNHSLPNPMSQQLMEADA